MQYFFILMMVAFSATSAVAQTSSDTSLQLLEQIRILQLKNEATSKQIELEADQWRLEQERKHLDAEKARQRSEQSEQLERAETLAAKALKISEDAADDYRQDMLLQEARSANGKYLLLFFAVVGLIAYFSIHSSLKDGGMKKGQKIGVLVMSISLFLFLLTLTLAEGWVAQIDIFQNIMSTLRISYFPEYNSEFAPKKIDFSAKYLLIVLLGVFLYGFLVFVGVFSIRDELKSNVDMHDKL